MLSLRLPTSLRPGMRLKALWILALLGGFAGCGGDETAVNTASAKQNMAADVVEGVVTKERLLAADHDKENWLSHGRTYDEQRYSPLTQITSANVGQLGLAWHVDLPTKRGVEATPLVIDGVMFTTGPWSMVYAIDVRSGHQIWSYDPQVDRSWVQYSCCDAVNRGVAAWGKKIYVGTLDGYLVALDAESGAEIWRIDTIGRRAPYTITGAPRVIKGKVIIGNGGADYGVRGYVTAYDADTGRRVWRTYTVPGDPSRPFESTALEKAAGTWTGEWWKTGGGGSVWDSMAYDPTLDLLYIGIGNGGPWNPKLRSPLGGDNLYLSSIMALRAETGDYVWHYQTTPGDAWDYTASQHIVLADMNIAGKPRKVLMQAPKNGFFYLLDRASGELISARNFVPVSWASQVDPATGRPVVNAEARYWDGQPALIRPGPAGAHSWQPMAFDPKVRRVFIPATDAPAVYAVDKHFEFKLGLQNTGTDFAYFNMPEEPDKLEEALAQTAALSSTALIAWDPVEQKEIWRFKQDGPAGGVLATAGGLVFEGNGAGEFAAFDTSTGRKLWHFDAQTSIMAAPISFGVDGSQYISVMVGFGGASLIGGPGMARRLPVNRSRVLTFRLGASQQLPAIVPELPKVQPDPPAEIATAAQIAQGRQVYTVRCASCHGLNAVSSGLIPDLRYLDANLHKGWDGIVIYGAKRTSGMPSFDKLLSLDETDAIHAYVIHRAWDLKKATSAPAAKP
ncbi:MAG TPA: PQQ-dependent dehydrogenase, methanol/ethanol family [Steroidobacteraceae bacterium]|nr:PQQ-dependent dehydrogenase, methanol/ethanol family [Steroidobacteraceae bacterium]